jgi:hypothetical protein
MIIRLAEVRDQFDPQRKGNFLAKISGFADSNISVKLTSQYMQGGSASLKFPPPSKGTQVIVCQPDGCGDWYFMSSTGQKGPPNPKKGAEPAANSNPDSDNSRHRDSGGNKGAGTGMDTRIGWENDLGCGFLATQDRSKTGQNVYTKMYTPQNKHIKLDDSRAIDAVILNNGSGDATIRLTAYPADPVKSPARMIKVDSVGPQKYICHESQTDIVVMDGRELNVLNHATGKYAASGSGKNHFGNVNLQSKYNDVNIFTNQPYLDDRDVTDGRVFIECLNSSGYEQVIQIQTHGEGVEGENACVIRVLSSNKIEIKSTADLDIECGGTINMKSEGDVNISAGGEINMQAGGNINADGAEIYFNSGQSSPAEPEIGDSESFYGRDGVTTYK